MSYKYITHALAWSIGIILQMKHTFNNLITYSWKVTLKLSKRSSTHVNKPAALSLLIPLALPPLWSMNCNSNNNNNNNKNNNKTLIKSFPYLDILHYNHHHHVQWPQFYSLFILRVLKNHDCVIAVWASKLKHAPGSPIQIITCGILCGNLFHSHRQALTHLKDS